MKEANYPNIVILDSDDILLPWHLSNYAQAFAAGHDWVWLSHQIYSEGESIRGIVTGTFNVFAFTKAAWEKVGGYRSLTVGEDRDFVNRVTKECKGIMVKLSPESASYVYRWNIGISKTSGQGDDAPGRMTAHDRIAAWAAERIKAGEMPTGDIVLQPAVKLDWVKMLKDFIAAEAIKAERKAEKERALCKLK